MKSQSIIGYSKTRAEFDFYSTPPIAVSELLRVENISGSVWECACGNGVMSEAIRSFGYDVYSSDLRNSGYGDGGVDFLLCNRKTDNVITNPPFCLAEKFVIHGLEVAQKKVALLLKLAFLEGNRRHALFSSTPLSKVIVFSKRITLFKNAVATKAGMMAFAWFVWEQGYNKNPEITWCNYAPQNTMEICHTAPNSAMLQGLKPHAGNTGTSA